MCDILTECRRQCAQGFSQSMNLIEILKSDLSKYEWKTKKKVITLLRPSAIKTSALYPWMDRISFVTCILRLCVQKANRDRRQADRSGILYPNPDQIEVLMLLCRIRICYMVTFHSIIFRKLHENIKFSTLIYIQHTNNKDLE